MEVIISGIEVSMGTLWPITTNNGQEQADSSS